MKWNCNFFRGQVGRCIEAEFFESTGGWIVGKRSKVRGKEGKFTVALLGWDS